MQREVWMWPYGKWRKVSLTSSEMPCSFPPALLFISFPLWNFLQVVVAIPCAVSWLLLRICAMKGHFCNLKTKPNCFVGYRDPSGTESLNWSGHVGLTFAQQREGSPLSEVMNATVVPRWDFCPCAGPGHWLASWLSHSSSDSDKWTREEGLLHSESVPWTCQLPCVPGPLCQIYSSEYYPPGCILFAAF